PRNAKADVHERVPRRGQLDLASHGDNIGEVLTQTGRLSDAIDVYERARTINDGLVKEHPTLTFYQSGLAFSLSGLGRTHRLAGRSVEAITNLRRAIALRELLPYLSNEARFDLARDHALLAALSTAPGSGLSAGAGQVEADRAVDALRQVVGFGFRN